MGGDWSTATYIFVSIAMIANVLFTIWVSIGGWFDTAHHVPRSTRGEGR